MSQRVVANVIWECDLCEIIFSSQAVALDNSVIKVGEEYSDIFLSSRMADTVKDCPVCGGAQNPRVAEYELFSEDEDFDETDFLTEDEAEEPCEKILKEEEENNHCPCKKYSPWDPYYPGTYPWKPCDNPQPIYYPHVGDPIPPNPSIVC
jgi:hypothetical protein